MRIALISDVHANLDALDAVLAHATARGIDATWHLGDLVGYGPDPEAVVERLSAIGAVSVMGNHDAAAAGLLGTDNFNELAREAIEWTAATISEATRAYLRAMPLVHRAEGLTCVHGSLRDPLWEYLTSIAAAKAHFAAQETPLGAAGHTHLPLVVYEDEDGEIEGEVPEDNDIVVLRGRRTCINPGGVGQPRDGDPRAAYVIFDTVRVSASFHRVPYDIAAVQRRMRAAGLPAPLIDRLARGR